ncbi:cytoplasm protein [Penicillium sp. CMV-2018d]|nr:cytoplasm protein [Penicillium sp. CMV-2018d]
MLVSDGIDAYHAAPAIGQEKQVGTALLFIPDIMGVWHHAKLLADQYAAHGYLCLVPDIFLGDPTDFDVNKWIMQGSDGSSPHTPNIIDAVVKEAIFYLNSKHGVAKLGAVGICLGAKPTLVIGIITDWPSIFAAENDSIFTTEKRHKSEQILFKKDPKVPYQLLSVLKHWPRICSSLQYEHS